jgi:hypothetical protein
VTRYRDTNIGIPKLGNRYRDKKKGMTRCRQFCIRYRRIYADIVPDMTPISVNIGVYPFLATTDIVSFFTDIGVEVNTGPDITPISVSYRCIPVSCHHRYRDFRRHRPDGPDMYPILQTIPQYTEIGANFQRHRCRCVINITIY